PRKAPTVEGYAGAAALMLPYPPGRLVAGDQKRGIRETGPPLPHQYEVIHGFARSQGAGLSVRLTRTRRDGRVGAGRRDRREGHLRVRHGADRLGAGRGTDGGWAYGRNRDNGW